MLADVAMRLTQFLGGDGDASDIGISRNKETSYHHGWSHKRTFAMSVWRGIKWQVSWDPLARDTKSDQRLDPSFPAAASTKVTCTKPIWTWTWPWHGMTWPNGCYAYDAMAYGCSGSNSPNKDHTSVHHCSSCISGENSYDFMIHIIWRLGNGRLLASHSIGLSCSFRSGKSWKCGGWLAHGSCPQLWQHEQEMDHKVETDTWSSASYK